MGGHNDRPVSGTVYGPKEVVPDHRDTEALETLGPPTKPLAFRTLRVNYPGLLFIMVSSVVLWVMICLGMARIWHWLWQ